MFFHHSDQRTAEDQHDIAVLQKLIPDILQDGWECWVCFDHVWKLIKHDYLFLVRLVCCDRTKQVSPIRKRHIAKQRIPRGSCDHTGHSLHALCLNLLRGEEIYGRLILDKFLDQPGLSDAPPAVDHNKAAFAAIFLFQRLQFTLPSNKFHFGPRPLI